MVRLAAAITFLQLDVALQVHLRPSAVCGHLSHPVPGGGRLKGVAGHPSLGLYVSGGLELPGFAGVSEIHDELVGLQFCSCRSAPPPDWVRVSPLHGACGQSLGFLRLAGLVLPRHR